MGDQHGDSDVDMSEIHPAFLEDTLRRVSSIRNFLKGDRSSESLRQTAKQIGLSPSRTGRLIRSFDLHHDPKLISADGRRGTRSASNARRTFVREAIEGAIGRLGTAADARDIERLVVEACEEASHEPPSSQTVWKALARARRANRSPATGVDPVILVGRVWFQLPVAARKGGEIDRPEALIALRLPDKAIRGCVSNLRIERKPRLQDLLGLLEEPVEVRATSIEIGNIKTAASISGIVADDSAQNEFIRHLGNGIGELDVMFRRPRTDASNLLGRRRQGPMPIETAIDAIDIALARHQRQVEHSE